MSSQGEETYIYYDESDYGDEQGAPDEPDEHSSAMRLQIDASSAVSNAVIRHLVEAHFQERIEHRMSWLPIGGGWFNSAVRPIESKFTEDLMEQRRLFLPIEWENIFPEFYEATEYSEDTRDTLARLLRQKRS
ncbi:hypothetical protein C8J56DRAFT_1037723 [Mycena floridula]|nr:hypothetical protein C8J56DRAFT_1037723 [Mycena floridula]